MTFDEIIAELRHLGNAEKVLLKEKKFGIVSKNALGIYHKDLKILAKTIGKNNELAIKLFDSGIYEARILCSKLFSPKEITEELMEKWVQTFENWEVCDSFSMGLFAKSEFAVAKINEWYLRPAEFEKRAAFATMAAYCMADKKAENEVFEQFFALIKQAATDERQYVKKAVNWALRNIGKRNVDLHKMALVQAHEILELDSKAAKWIARDAIRQLTKKKVNILDYPRVVYRIDM
ncbi:MAG: DNA alkylation repair protein [Chitinophagales bacterium]